MDVVKKTSIQPGLPVLSEKSALFCDIDGTLLDIAPTPDAVWVPPELPHLLNVVGKALDGAVALVSGRTINWIDQKLTPFSYPIAGQHGAEMRLTPNGPVQLLVGQRDLTDLRTKAMKIAAAIPGVLMEDKGLAIAFHYRTVPDREPELRDHLRTLLHDLGPDMQLLPGKMVFEIKPVAAWKERAVEILMEVEPFVGRVPVFIGDDHTDEGAFRAARRRGGRAIQVGPTVSKHATSWVESPAAVRKWLASVPAMLEGPTSA
jgi:trehalose 6-phosphate phosphatase